MTSRSVWMRWLSQPSMAMMFPPKQLRADVKKYIIDAVIPSNMVDSNTKFHINPTGRFVIGGPHGDTGLTGRKIIVDTYGGMGRHGGGAFSGKDPTKVDRSACYMARYVAKNLVAAGLASRVEVQLAYAIGVAEPVSIMVNTFGTGKVEDARLAEIVRETFSLTPRHDQVAQLAAPGLSEDSGFRPLWTHGRHLHLGEGG